MNETATAKPFRQQQVLEAAARLANTGEPVSLSVIAKELGMSPSNTHKVIKTLKAKGLWDHQSPVPVVNMDAVDVETKAIREICSQLASLPSRESRKRVLDYVRKSGGGAN